MDILEYEDYRTFLKASLNEMPNGGHGQNKRLAKAAGISPAFLSQVLADKRQLTMEQGALLAEFFGLNEVQTEYFLTLIEFDRAGNPSLRSHLRRRQERLRAGARSIAKRFSSVSEVAESDRPIYYSDWAYIAIQQLTAIAGFDSEFEIARALDLPLRRVNQIRDFLVQSGLCEEKNGRLEVGPKRIHLTPDSPWIKQHHSNWRSRALENYDRQSENQKLHYSAPMTLSQKDCEKVRALLLATIESVGKIVDTSPSEELVCMNIDWFRLTR